MLARKVATILALLAVSLMWSHPAAADSYTVAYAIDMSVAYDADIEGTTDKGQISCEYSDGCEIKLEKLGLSIRFYFSAKNRIGSLYIEGLKKPGCCYFSGGRDSTRVEMSNSLQKLPIYWGDRPRRNEVVSNVKVGELYVAVSRDKSD
jgi:hypothetical protein